MVTLAGPSDIVEELNAMIAAGLRFPAILIDPPWTFKTYSAKGEGRSPKYRRMTLAEILALPIEQIATKDCCVFLWCTWPMLRHGLRAIDSWNFIYKTDAFTWVKLNRKNQKTLFTGLGYWTRSNSEFCLLATRGHPKRLAKDVHQIILAPVRRHSEKPAATHGRIERLVDGPYLELFARKFISGTRCPRPRLNRRRRGGHRPLLCHGRF